MNNPGITIEDVDLQLDKSGRYIEGKAHVVITLKNNSKTSAYYVLERPRNIGYDKASRTLSIDLYEKELPHESASPFEPEQIAIPPDTIFQWQALISIWIKKITRPPGAREIIDVVDISSAQNVVCTVAYHTCPYRPKQEEELSKWGETVSANFERTIK